MSPTPPKSRSTDYRVDPFDLHLLLAVLERGSITAGADWVSLSLAAASARLRALEARVGMPLLLRSKAGVQATDAGLALARQARRVLAELDGLHLEMAAFGAGLRGTLRVLGNTAALAEALPPRLGLFLREHPELDVDLQELPSDAVLEALRRDAADLGLVADHVDTRGLVCRRWRADPLVALLPRGWPLARRHQLGFAELLDQPFVGLGRDSGLSRFLLAQAARGGRVPRHRVRLGSLEALVQMVAAGVGVAVVPQSAAQRLASQALHARPLSDAWARQRWLLLCTTAASDARPATQALVQALLAT